MTILIKAKIVTKIVIVKKSLVSTRNKRQIRILAEKNVNSFMQIRIRIYKLWI